MNDVSFEINFREKKIFKYVHVQMALPKKIFKCFFFCHEMELPYLYLTATSNKEFTGKRSLTSFCAKSSEKKGRSTIFHELKSVVNAKIAQNSSQVS